MTKKHFLFSAALLLAASSAFAQGNGLSGINEATSMVTSYFDPATKLIYAIGAVVGLIGGVGVMEAVNFFMDRAAAASPSQFSMFKNPTLDLSTAVSATLVLIVAGMIAGYVPARRAARIKAIDAMRHNK